MERRCNGCGSLLQTTDIKKKGYIKEELMQSSLEELRCERCYNLKHYNRNTNIEITEEDFKKNINFIRKDGGLVINIVDLFDLDGTLISEINEYFPNNDILLVLNKFDLFLNSVNVNRIKQYLIQYLKDHNVSIKDIIVISSHKHEDIKRLMNKIFNIIDYKNYSKNLFFFGTTNVGKSTIINKIIKYYYPDMEDIITVSNMVSTTLDLIKIPLDKKTFLIDTPGIINHRQLTYYLDKDTLNKVMPKKYIKPKVYQLNVGQTLFINGFVRLDFINGKKANFIVNVSNELIVHRTKTINADDFFSQHADDLLKIPNIDERKILGNIIQKRFSFNNDVKEEISISGLGSITIIGDADVLVHYYEKIDIKKRKGLI